ncbi:MAG: hypothetical protein QOE24_2010 [Frankiales bacterium]|nr:hypothetical protein [Frankiales bacterium]
MLLQPLLHDLVTCVCAPTTVLSGRDGQLRGAGAQGAFHADVRVLSRAEVRVDGREPEAVLAVLDGSSAAGFTLLARWLGDRGADPSVRLDRHRRATSTGLVERLSVASTAGVAVRCLVELELEADFATVHAVKMGEPAPVAEPPEVSADEAVWRRDDGLVVRVRAAGTELALTLRGVRLSWPVELAPGGSRDLSWELHVTDPGAVVARPKDGAGWVRPSVQADDRRLPQLLEQSLDDLDGLRLVLPDRPADQFLAAGSPWFLTLFGRDSLWAARMMLPLGTELAAGTLSALASRQGTTHDPATEEAAGKIMHELRRGSFGVDVGQVGGAVVLPPAYYGTVDATALWVVLLHDAWRWGMAPASVEALLPHLEAAVGWLTGPADADGDGFLEYVDSFGRGLSNQGWKDSGDSVRFRDGTQAAGPIALAEVQGYAFEAAGCAAALLGAFGRPGGDRLLHWREELAERFRRAFWVEDAAGPYPAMALDGHKGRVDALTSNIGHLLGTGLLTAAEAKLVAGRLSSPEMDSGYGLRTMSTQDRGYSPLSYHCGSVWPHDTAIVISGLVREGLPDEAASLVRGLLAAGSGFDGRLPELWAGDPADRFKGPLPYPAACRPQAWSAAAAVSVLRDLIGLSADVPAGLLGLKPLAAAPAGALRVRGLAVAGGRLDVDTDRNGAVLQVSAPGGLDVRTETVGRATYSG